MIRSCVLGAVLLILPWLAQGQGPEQAAGLRLRRPIALALLDNGARLLVANRDSSTIAVIDTRTRNKVTELKLGGKLSDMCVTRGGNLVLATTEETGELVAMAYQQGSLKVVRRLPAGNSPVNVRITDDDLYAAVACLWPRRVLIFELATLAHKNAMEPRVVELPFAPRRQLVIPGRDKLLVADAFGGKVAVVALVTGRVESLRDLNVHNIRGLSLERGGKGVWLSHQVLHAQGHTTIGDIRTGNLITNNVRRLALAGVLDPLGDILGNDRLYSLGDVELGAGDPAEVAEGPAGELLVALAGVNELAIGRPEQGLWTRLAVGRRPTALVVDTAARRAYMANTLDDSLTVVDLQVPKVIGDIRLGPPADLRPEERGEQLFFDARLSFESWYSCHSCHTDGHTNGRLNDNFTDGSFGTPKRVLSLLGVKDTGPWAWNGKIADLETQVRTSIKSTMQGLTPTPDQVRDLTAFLHTLTPPPALLPARGNVEHETWKRGRKVFARQKCATCHTPPTYTSPKAYDVGLRDEVGGTQFNPPSLRGVSQGGPYFHDNRAGSLDDIFTRYRHEIPGKLPDDELRDLLAYLRSL